MQIFVERIQSVRSNLAGQKSATWTETTISSMTAVSLSCDTMSMMITKDTKLIDSEHSSTKFQRCISKQVTANIFCAQNASVFTRYIFCIGPN